MLRDRRTAGSACAEKAELRDCSTSHPGSRPPRSPLLLRPHTVSRGFDKLSALNTKYHIVGARENSDIAVTSGRTADEVTGNDLNGLNVQKRRIDIIKGKFANDTQGKESNDSAIVSDLELEAFPEACVVDLGMIHEEEYQSDQV